MTIINLVDIGVFSTFLPYLFVQIGMKSKPHPMLVSMFFLMEPLISTGIGNYFFGETLTIVNWCGAGLVMCCICIFPKSSTKGIPHE